MRTDHRKLLLLIALLAPAAGALSALATGCLEIDNCGAPCETNPGGIECTTDDQCPGSGINECMKPVCLNGTCTDAPVGSKQPCGKNFQNIHCDGAGNCVCDTAADCGNKTECQSWACSGTPKQCVVANQATDLFADPPGDCTTRSCGADGKLIEMHDDSDPANDNNECTTDSCMADGTTSHAKLTGHGCGNGPECMGSSLKPQDTCQDGICSSATLMDCGLYACDSGTSSCKASCGGDADCSDAYCGGNTCLPKMNQGAVCSSANQCSSGYCTDGVCCESACDGPCVSCNLGGGTPGKCSPLPKGVKDACIGQDQLCDGDGQCQSTPFKAVAQPCKDDSDCFNDNCANGLCRLPAGTPCEQSYRVECMYNFCRANGTCGQCTTDSDCAPGTCDPITKNCRLVVGETCGISIHCVTDTCANNVCAKGAAGKPCQGGSDCISGLCGVNQTCQ